jgi:hypothetical protein
VYDSIGGVFATLVLMAFLSCAGRLPVLLAAMASFTFAGVGVATAHLRFRACSALRISADECRLVFLGRDSAAAELRWDDVTGASHATLLGSQWAFKSLKGELTVRDDGISAEEWRDFSALIVHVLEARHVPLRVDLQYKMWVEKPS